MVKPVSSKHGNFLSHSAPSFDIAAGAMETPSLLQGLKVHFVIFHILSSLLAACHANRNEMSTTALCTLT